VGKSERRNQRRMGKVKVSVSNERKVFGYHKDCCMAMETYYTEYQNQ